MVARYKNIRTGVGMEIEGISCLREAETHKQSVCDEMDWEEELFHEDIEISIILYRQKRF